MRPAIVLIAVFTLILVLLKFLTNSWHKAGMWALVPIIFLSVIIQGNAFLLGLAVVLSFALIIDKGRVSANGTAVMNVFAALQVIAAAFIVIPVSFVSDDIKLAGSIPAGTKLTEKPSIIHIVMDGYGARDVLAEVYGHDNSPFEAALKERGFIVMDRAFTPNNQTFFTMAAVMNGTYVRTEDLPDIENPILRLQLSKAISKGAIPQILRAEGYEIAFANNSLRGLRFGDGAVRVTGPPAIFNSIETRFFARLWRNSTLANADHNAQLRNAFESKNYMSFGNPFFYYQHVVSPHAPFSMTADGEDRRTISPSLRDASHFVQNSTDNWHKYIEGYSEKLKYTNKALLRQLQDLPSGPLVVIVHGDHGPGSLFDHESLGQSCALERFATLFAVYSNIPSVHQAFADLFDEPFNLANTYRVLLSALSDSELENLPDVSFFNRWSEPRHLERVSPDVRAASCTAHPLYQKAISAGAPR